MHVLFSAHRFATCASIEHALRCARQVARVRTVGAIRLMDTNGDKRHAAKGAMLVGDKDGDGLLSVRVLSAVVHARRWGGAFRRLSALPARFCPQRPVALSLCLFLLL
jgi:hypothetical protein